MSSDKVVTWMQVRKKTRLLIFIIIQPVIIIAFVLDFVRILIYYKKGFWFNLKYNINYIARMYKEMIMLK